MRFSQQLIEAVQSPLEFDIPEREELVKLWMSYKSKGVPYSREVAERMADNVLKRSRHPRNIEKAKQQVAQAQKQYAREVAAGKKHAGILGRVTPGPSRDVKPFTDALSKARGVEEVNLITTGQRLPFAFWKPFPPVELVVYIGEIDRATGKEMVSIEDGNHRLRAAKQAGATEIRAKISWRDQSGNHRKEVTAVLPIR